MDLTFEKRDNFKRKLIAEKLLVLLGSEIAISPIVIDGPWGSGKTEFSHKFINLIKSSNQNYQCLYLDTYKYDHSDDPLLMLVTGISSLLKDGAKKDSLLAKSIPVAKVLSKLVGRAAAGWLLKTNAETIGEDISQAMNDSKDDFLDLGIKKIFKDFEEIEENLNLFKEALIEVSMDKPLLILLDELDRCRPSFALSLLEKIKHVFDVPGITFIFTTNLPQLESVVKKQYGYSIDSEKYLSKFFNLVIRLPDESEARYGYKKNSYIQFRDLIRGDDSLSKFFFKTEHSEALLEYIFAKDQLSIRDAERLFRNLQILNALSSESSIKENTHWVFGTLQVLAVYLYTFNTDSTKKLLDQNLTENDVSKIFHRKPGFLKMKAYSNSVDMFYAVMLLYCDSDESGAALNEEEKKYWDDFLQRMFQGSWGAPSKSDKLKIMIKTVKELQLIQQY